ncbi:MAG: alpha-amylase [Thermoplasmata archaeon]|nr:MAG: alpha-amylase [Thermoplasmata archaeon]
MPSVCFYFEVHQPVRLNRFSVFSICSDEDPSDLYFNHDLNRNIFERVARKCYLPTNKLIYNLISESDGKFKVSFSLTGVFLEYAELLFPTVLDSFEELLKTGCVALIGETYYHSLSSLYNDLKEFEDEVRLHLHALENKFGYTPRVFRNTEAIYDNRIAKKVEDIGFHGIITEGTEKILNWRSPNYLYKPINANIKVLLRNYNLSDDIAFRFSASNWCEYPLTSEKFARWLSNCEGDIVNIFIDYETFGEHQWPETGIFNFLRHLPKEVLKYDNLNFVTVNDAIERFSPVGELDVPFAISWTDTSRDVSAWLENDLQRACFHELQVIGKMLEEKPDERLMRVWRLLQTSDHLYYLSTKGLEDGTVHKYFNPYNDPYEGFINFMNIIQDLKQRLENR